MGEIDCETTSQTSRITLLIFNCRNAAKCESVHRLVWRKALRLSPRVDIILENRTGVL